MGKRNENRLLHLAFQVREGLVVVMLWLKKNPLSCVSSEGEVSIGPLSWWWCFWILLVEYQ